MKTKNVNEYFALQKGPLPSLPSKVKYPFRKMEVGHYFDAPRELDHTLRVRASQHGRKYGHRYRVSRIQRKEDGVLCVRVQRIA